MTESMTADNRAALHEAGHAVMAWVLGRGITHIAIRSAGVHRGRTDIGSFETPAHPMDLEARRRWGRDHDRRYLLAGAVAETIAFGNCDLDVRRVDLTTLVAIAPEGYPVANRARAVGPHVCTIGVIWPC
jgi:hypothetical protein